MTTPASEAWRRGGIVAGLAWVLLSLLAACWAVATPVGAAPDEPAHLVKGAAIWHGQWSGEDTPSGQLVRVPEWIAETQSQTCFAFEPETTPDCAAPSTGDDDLVVSITSAGRYNPSYYLLTSWPVLLADDQGGVYAMRIASGLVVSLVTALGIGLLATWRTWRLPVLGALVAATPMTLFLGGVVNPNALENAAAFTAVAGMLTIVLDQAHGRRLTVAVLVVGAVTAVGVNLRALGPLWLAIAVLAPLVLLSLPRLRGLVRHRGVWTAAGLAVLGLAAAGAWTLRSNALAAGMDTPPPGTPGIGESPANGFLWTLLSSAEYGQGIIGVFGWLDTPAPLGVFTLWAALLGVLLIPAGAVLRGRALLLVGGLAILLLLLPPILQGVYIQRGGIIWQGRYALPLFSCLVVAAACALAVALRGLSGRIVARLAIILAACWFVAQALAFGGALRRYAVGLSAGWLEMLDPEWAPPGGVLPVAMIAVVVLAATAGVVATGVARGARSLPTSSDPVVSG